VEAAEGRPSLSEHHARALEHSAATVAGLVFLKAAPLKDVWQDFPCPPRYKVDAIRQCCTSVGDETALDRAELNRRSPGSGVVDCTRGGCHRSRGCRGADRGG